MLAALEAGSAFPGDIAEITCCALQTVRNALSKLRKKGHAEPTGEREGRAEQVRITEAGSSYLRTYLYKEQVSKYDRPRPDEPSDYDRMVEGRMAELPVDCPHGFAHGKGCYVCDPDHPYRKKREA